MSEFNLNDMCKVELTEHGKIVLAKQWAEYDEFPSDSYLNGNFSIHELMNTFGKEMYMGNPKQCFVANKVTVIPEKENE